MAFVTANLQRRMRHIHAHMHMHMRSLRISVCSSHSAETALRDKQRPHAAHRLPRRVHLVAGGAPPMSQLVDFLPLNSFVAAPPPPSPPTWNVVPKSPSRLTFDVGRYRSLPCKRGDNLEGAIRLGDTREASVFEFI